MTMTALQEEHLSDLLKHPGWPLLEQLLFGDAQTLLGMSLVVRKDCSAGVQGALRKLGLDVPENQEEQLRVYLAMRAVIGYVTEKKKQLDTFKTLREEKMRQGIENGQLKPQPQVTLRGN